MTETYNGPWSPVKGDTPKERVQDAYHRYPVSQPVGVLAESLSGAYQIEAVSAVASPAGNGE